MEERYIRNLGALTEQECALLHTKTVFVAGCGGLGGYLIEMLLRLGVGTIRAADGDAFEASNLNRQLLSSPQTLGQSKAEAAAEVLTADWMKLLLSQNQKIYTIRLFAIRRMARHITRPEL